jgi:hypothetical protein
MEQINNFAFLTVAMEHWITKIAMMVVETMEMDAIKTVQWK